MSLFGAIDIAGSGVDAMQNWIDTTGSNVANSNDAVATNQPTYAEQSTVLSAVGGGIAGQPSEGVQATDIQGSTTGVIAYEPQNPLADSQGDVKVPNIELSNQLVSLIEAQESYSANTDVMSKAVAAYGAGLTIGS